MIRELAHHQHLLNQDLPNIKIEAGLKYLNEGDELTYEVENTDKGPSAVKLQKTS